MSCRLYCMKHFRQEKIQSFNMPKWSNKTFRLQVVLPFFAATKSGLSLTGGPFTQRSLFSFNMPYQFSSSLFFILKFASDYVFAIPQWGQWQVPKILKGKSRKGRQAILMHNPKNKSINDPSLIGNQVYTRQFRLSFFFVVSYYKITWLAIAHYF